MNNLNNLVSEIDNIVFKEGSVRSLALTIKKIVGDENAWNIARQVGDKYGKDFTRENALEYIKSLQKTTVKEAKAQVKAQKSTGDSKNGKIRAMIAEGISIADIAKAVGVKYQRAKNVEKALKKRKALIAGE